MEEQPDLRGKRGKILFAGVLLAFSLWLGCSAVSAATIDWALLGWTPGATSMTYYATNVAPTNVGGIYFVDSNWSGYGSVTISISGQTNFNSGYPATGTLLTGGNSGTNQNSLALYMNSFNSLTDKIVVTVSFNNYGGGITGLTTTLFDVDRSSNTTGSATTFTWIDQVRYIHAGDQGSSNIAPVLLTGSSSNKVAGAGTTNNAVTGINPALDNGNKGNVGINFGTNTVDMFQFTYGNAATNVTADPTAQAIGLYDISFTSIGKPKVPEFHPGLVSVIVCGSLVLRRVVRSHRFS